MMLHGNEVIFKKVYFWERRLRNKQDLFKQYRWHRRFSHILVRVGPFKDRALTMRRARQLAEKLARKALIYV